MKLKRDIKSGSLILKQTNMRLTHYVCLIKNFVMRHVGLKQWMIDSRNSTKTVRKGDRQREEDEWWRKMSVMKWKKLSVGGNDVYAATLYVFLCVWCWVPVSVSSKTLHVFSCETPLYLSQLKQPTLLCVPLSLSLYPAILSHQGLLSSGLICRSSSANLIGDTLSLAWRGDELPNPFRPLAWGSLPSAVVQYCTLTQQLQPQPWTQAEHWLWIQKHLWQSKWNQTHPMLIVLLVLNHATAPNTSLAELFHLNMTLRGSNISTVGITV